jgi:hypothetical protein
LDLLCPSGGKRPDQNRAAVNPHKRVRDLGVGSPISLVLLGAVLSETYEEEEAEIHARLDEHCVQGEWFVAEIAFCEMQRLEPRMVPPEELVPQKTHNDVLDTNMNVRVRPEEMAAWKHAAQREGLSLSQWARNELEAAAEDAG